MFAMQFSREIVIKIYTFILIKFQVHSTYYENLKVQGPLYVLKFGLFVKYSFNENQ